VAAQSLKTVHLVTRAETLKALYFDWQTQLARPNLVFIDGEGTVVFETNEIGLKGEPVDERRKLVVVWGDSVVFGAWRGWACLLDTYAPGYQFLNGGIEGDPYDNILRRARRLNRERPVVLNVVMPGWHPFEPYPVATPAGPPPKNWWRRGQSAASEPGRFRAELTSFIRDVPNTVLLTMPTSLNPAIADRDLSGYFTAGDDDTMFHFCGTVPYTVALQRQHLDFINRRNEIVRDVAGAAQVPLIDLFAVFDTTGLADFRQDFVDIMHFRVHAYPRIAAAIHRGIAGLLAM
jgi:hypothetical protein